MTDDDASAARDRARARLDRGEWLRASDLGVLLGGDRFSAAYWLRAGIRLPDGERLMIRYRRTPGGMREANPEDVRRALQAYEQEHSGDGND